MPKKVLVDLGRTKKIAQTKAEKLRTSKNWNISVEKLPYKLMKQSYGLYYTRKSKK